MDGKTWRNRGWLAEITLSSAAGSPFAEWASSLPGLNGAVSGQNQSYGPVSLQYSSSGGGSWNLAGETHYLYDGMRVVQERDGGNNPAVSYTRGRDLSGSFEGAGGIGGLLARSSGYSSGSWGTRNFYFADGNGNVVELIDNTASPNPQAQYTYDAYGRLMASGGALATANVYQFSSKELHANSGFYYYGYRFYSPYLQKWVNRDPIEEEGG